MFYITTPIYYVNDDPHIGHLYTSISADVLARFHRLMGHPTFLLLGTDEHAVKVVDAARANHLSPLEWTEKKATVFAEAFRSFGIEATDFIRTSQPRHVQEVTNRMKELIASEDVILGQYEGWYDQGQEEYIPELKARSLNFLSPINKKPLVKRQEPCFYFKLSRYATEIKQLIEEDKLKIRPHARRQEILARFREDIKDVPCSRPRTEDWGVPMPGHEDQTVYVWIDALLNYLTAIDIEDRKAFWPPNIQIIGKDILWFHAVIWPAILLALRKHHQNEWLELPKLLRAHAFWVRDGEKMSKSMGNFVSLKHLNHYATQYGHDAIRFFLIAAGPNEAGDADFSELRLHESYNALLTNTLGNCCSRVVAMINKYCEGNIPEKTVPTSFAITEVQNIIKSTSENIETGEFTALIENALKIVRLVDAFIHETEPFKRIKDSNQYPQVCSILYDALEALRLASLLLWPVMPSRIELFWKVIGYDKSMSDLTSGGLGNPTELQWGCLQAGTTINTMEPLFPRIEYPLKEENK